jgi:hypothetical protein
VSIRLKWWIRAISLAGVTLFVGVVAIAWWISDPFEGQIRPVTPAEVSAQVRLHGAHWVVSELWDDHHWGDAVDGVGSGDARWLVLVPELAPGVDAAPAEELRDNLGLALPRNASAVLAAINPKDEFITGADAVCSTAFGNNFTYDLPADFAKRSIVAVEAVHDPRLAAVKGQCLDTLQSGVCRTCGDGPGLPKRKS